MAFEALVSWNRFTLIASSDFSASQYYAGIIDTNGQCALAGAGVNADGIMQDKPVIGRSGALVSGGYSKAVAGAAVTAGSPVMTDATGRFVPATAGNFIIGKAATAASGVGIVFTVLLRPGGKA